VKINRVFLLLKENIFMVKNRKKMFTIFTEAFFRMFCTYKSIEKVSFLRIGITKVKESERYVL